MSINRVIISGNLTRDPEGRMTNGGTYVLNLGVAVNDRRKDPQTGEWGDYPNYVDCTMFGNRAEAIERYLSKGTKVCIEGKLRWSSWEKDGQKRSKLAVVVEEIEFMSRSKDGGAQPARRAQAVPSYQQSASPSAYREPQPAVAYARQAVQTVQAAPAPELYDDELGW